MTTEHTDTAKLTTRPMAGHDSTEPADRTIRDEVATIPDEVTG